MDIEIKERFLEAWEKYFPGSELPIACFYANDLNNVAFPNAPKPNRKGYTCIFAQIAPVRKGRARAFNKENLGALDPSARTRFKPHLLTFSAPWPKFLSMLENMDKSFLATDSWLNLKSRFSRVK